ncbi:DNA polymerase subunit Cdc27 [Phlebopus sp. FC_14]|nr:DNA polymerase subunit Cdc27 [Phlebopus sp. FC_14]
MTMTQARDFLTKELFIKHNVVTFRSLSRELGIHVNDAKHELQAYYESTRDTDSPSVPTYMVSGEVASLCYKSNEDDSRRAPDEYADEYDMQLDISLDDDDEEPDVVLMNKMAFVDAKVLNETMSQFARVHSVHVYCLSPSSLKDADIICPAGTSVQNADVKGGAEMFPIIGKIAGKHVQLKPASARSAAIASSSKKTLDPPSKAAPVIKSEQPVQKGNTGVLEPKKEGPTKDSSSKVEPKAKPKATGKLDWSKAKSKDKAPVTETPKEASNVKAEPKTVPDNKSKQIFPEKQVSTSEQRTLKRKSRSLSDSEDEVSALSSAKNQPVTTSSTSSVKKGTILSDDDDDDDVRAPGRRRRMGKINIHSDSEMSLRAMMDIDDEEVVQASRRRDIRAESEEGSEAAELHQDAAHPLTSDAEDVDDVPVKQPKKRKPRKVVPVGRNGLKKKRVVKSKMTTDAKGYIQTVDYSSYESVEEEHVDVDPPKRTRKKNADPIPGAAVSKTASKEDVATKTTPKATSKARGAAPKRGGLLNFFGPEKGKK